MLASCLDNSAANVISLLDIVLVTHPLGVICEVAYLDTLGVKVFSTGRLPSCNCRYNFRNSVHPQFGASICLPLPSYVRILAIDGVGNFLDMVTGMVEVEDLYCA